ncbi:uncharacterized protein LOC128213412 [Mya arenaria]|uniref:uncharacterized protein LOC128213412 n=1 Tax=Mya arenaria TaxID=6604 RepID=UPI0022E9497B|nr:uncharacterized protein LOC128213412 [Mya arenaria]XP_052775037.1 uncharacterized protein LOC128213412 [Mya arenaria]
MCIAILFICLLLHIGSVDTQTDGFQAVDGFAQGDGFNKPDHPQSSFSAEGFVPAERDQASIDRARSTNGFQTIPVGKPAFNDRLGQRREPSNVNTEVVGDSRRNAIAMTKSVFANIANALDNLPPFPPNNEPNIHEPRSAWMQSDPNQSDIPMGVNGVDDGMTIWEESLQSVQQEMGINGSFPNFISEGIASGLDPMSNANTNLPADNSFGKAEPIPSANKPNVPDDNRINKISQGIPDSLRNNPMDFSLNDVLPISTEVAANAESVTDLRGQSSSDPLLSNDLSDTGRSSGLGTNIGVDTPMVNAGAEIQPDLVPQERAFPFDTQGSSSLFGTNFDFEGSSLLGTNFDTEPLSTSDGMNTPSNTKPTGGLPSSNGFTSIGTNSGVDTPMMSEGVNVQPNVVPQVKAAPSDTQAVSSLIGTNFDFDFGGSSLLGTNFDNEPLPSSGGVNTSSNTKPTGGISSSNDTSNIGTNSGVDIPLMNEGVEVQPDLVPQVKAASSDTRASNSLIGTNFDFGGSSLLGTNFDDEPLPSSGGMNTPSNTNPSGSLSSSNGFTSGGFDLNLNSNSGFTDSSPTEPFSVPSDQRFQPGSDPARPLSSSDGFDTRSSTTRRLRPISRSSSGRSSGFGDLAQGTLAPVSQNFPSSSARPGPFGTPTGSFDRRRSGSFDRSRPGFFDRQTLGSFDRPTSGIFDRPTMGTFDRPTSGTFDRPGPGIFDRPGPSIFDGPTSSTFDRQGTGTFDRPTPGSFDGQTPGSFGRSLIRRTGFQPFEPRFPSGFRRPREPFSSGLNASRTVSSDRFRGPVDLDRSMPPISPFDIGRFRDPTLFGMGRRDSTGSGQFGPPQFRSPVRFDTSLGSSSTGFGMGSSSSRSILPRLHTFGTVPSRGDSLIGSVRRTDMAQRTRGSDSPRSQVPLTSGPFRPSSSLPLPTGRTFSDGTRQTMSLTGTRTGLAGSRFPLTSSSILPRFPVSSLTRPSSLTGFGGTISSFPSPGRSTLTGSSFLPRTSFPSRTPSTMFGSHSLHTGSSTGSQPRFGSGLSRGFVSSFP